MAVKFFGQFLIEQGAINHATLLKAIDLQERANQKIGEVVFDMGLMSRLDIDKVHWAQRSEDTRFGDKAVEMHFLTQEQLKQALIKQRNNHLYIGEAVVEAGGLKEKELDHYLKMFKEDQKPYMVEKVEIPAGLPNQPIWEMVADMTYKMLSRVAGISFRPGACQLIDKLPTRTIVAEMGFSGSVSARYLLSASATSRKLVARAILQEDEVDDEPTEILNDSVMEFVNIVCGNIAAKAAQIGCQIDITPPMLHQPTDDGIPLTKNHTGLMFPIYLSDGEIFELAIFISNETS